MTILFDVSWVELDLRQKHKIWLMSKRGGSAWSDLLPNGATLRKLVGGSEVFGNRVVGGESWRQSRLWGRRSDVACQGLAPGALRQGARRADELTGVTAFEGLGSHAPPASRGKSLEIAAATYGK
jgi:hypothetical protein